MSEMILLTVVTCLLILQIVSIIFLFYKKKKFNQRIKAIKREIDLKNAILLEEEKEKQQLRWHEIAELHQQFLQKRR